MQKRKLTRTFLISLFVAVGFGSWMACNKGFDRVLQHKDYTDTTSAIAKTPKVLYVIIDGARGQSVRDANPPNIMGLTANAIYCWNSVTDTLTSDLTTWADLLTGVHKEKHGVLGNTTNNNDLKDYPVFFQRIKERRPDIRIAAFCAADSLSKGLITHADVNKGFGGDDAATENAALNELKVDSAGLVLVQFNEVNDAGAQYGYDLSVPQYKSAILAVDGYIGKLLDALKSRKNYAGEGWMVVVTSNHGGPFPVDPAQDDHTILSNPAVNSFVIFSALRYQPSFIDKPYTGNRYMGKGVELHGQDNSAVNAIVPNDGNDYNFGKDINFTVELKVKVMPGSRNYVYTYPSILAKRASFDPGKPGWCIFLEQKFWQINFGQVGQGNTQVRGINISDGTWHDIAAVIVNRGAKRYARTYTDGHFNNEVEITGKGNINSTAPLTMGFLPGSVNNPADLFISDVRIWKAALDDNTISQFACETSLPGDHPFVNFLAGYWPCLDGQNGIFKDHSTLQHDFQLQGNYQWTSFSDLVCAPASGDLANLMPQPVDIARQVLDWLQIPTDAKWDLDGKVWTTNYVGIKN
ncbi:MAG TPA: alkaline phosphatase family protein [Chitinophagaceae bacterium]